MCILLVATIYFLLEKMFSKNTQNGAFKHTADFKLNAIKDVRRSGNVSKIAAEYRVSRTTLYRWIQQHIEHGKSGLEPKKRTQHRGSKKSSPEIVDAILALTKTQPEWGCKRIANELNASGIKISSPTVQQILIERQLATQTQRANSLEMGWMDGKVKPTTDQYKAMRRHNPCLSDRAFFCKFPAQILCVGVYPLKGRTGSLIGDIVVVIELASLSVRCVLWDEGNHGPSNNRLQVQVRGMINSFRIKRDHPLYVVHSGTYAYNTTSKPDMLHQSLASIRNIKVRGSIKKVGAVRYFFQLLDADFLSIICKNRTFPPDNMKSSLESWVQRYNSGQKREGFPTFGLTPQECRSQIIFPASFCRHVPMKPI